MWEVRRGIGRARPGPAVGTRRGGMGCGPVGGGAGRVCARRAGGSAIAGPRSRHPCRNWCSPLFVTGVGGRFAFPCFQWEGLPEVAARHFRGSGAHVTSGRREGGAPRGAGSVLGDRGGQPCGDRLWSCGARPVLRRLCVRARQAGPRGRRGPGRPRVRLPPPRPPCERPRRPPSRCRAGPVRLLRSLGRERRRGRGRNLRDGGGRRPRSSVPGRRGSAARGPSVQLGPRGPRGPRLSLKGRPGPAALRGRGRCSRADSAPVSRCGGGASLPAGGEVVSGPQGCAQPAVRRDEPGPRRQGRSFLGAAVPLPGGHSLRPRGRCPLRPALQTAAPSGRAVRGARGPAVPDRWAPGRAPGWAVTKAAVRLPVCGHVRVLRPARAAAWLVAAGGRSGSRPRSESRVLGAEPSACTTRLSFLRRRARPPEPLRAADTAPYCVSSPGHTWGQRRGCAHSPVPGPRE